MRFGIPDRYISESQKAILFPLVYNPCSEATTFEEVLINKITPAKNCFKLQPNSLKKKKITHLFEPLFLILYLISFLNFFLSIPNFFLSMAERLRGAYGQSSNTEVNVGPGVIPADVLASRARAYRETVAADRSVMPSSASVFSTRLQRFARIGMAYRRDPASTRRIENELVGQIQGTDVIDVAVPFLGPQEHTLVSAALDERLSMTARSRSSNATRATVGVVEVTVDGLVAQGADTVVGAALYDARHGNRENAFLGAFASTISNRPARVLFYPQHTVSLLQPDAGSTLRLAMVVPNNDMRSHDVVAHITTSSVTQLNAHVDHDTPTVSALNSALTDRTLAVRYLNQNMRVIHGPERPSGIMPDINIPLPRATSMRQTSTLNFEEVVAPQQSVVLRFDQHGRNSVDFGHKISTLHNPRRDLDEDSFEGQAAPCLEFEMSTPVPNFGEMTQRLLFSGRFCIPTNVVAGTRIAVYSLDAILSSNLGCSKLMKSLTQVPGKILIRSNCSVSPTCGIALAWMYCERGAMYRSPIAIKNALSFPHILWNPACQDSVDFLFAPFSCSADWLPRFVSTLSSHVSLYAVTSWIQAPKAAPSIQFAAYFMPDEIHVPRIISVHDPTNVLYSRYVGAFTFAQSSHESAKVVELCIGKPIIHESDLGYCLASSLMSQFQYWSADVVIEVVKASSPFVSATIAIALLPGDHAWNITQENLGMIPHVTVAINPQASRYVCKIPKRVIGMAGIVNPLSLKMEKNKQVSMNLAIWVRDSVNSAADGDLKLLVTVAELRDLELFGSSAGFPLSASRAQNALFTSDIWNDVFKFVVSDSTKGSHDFCFSPHNPGITVIDDKTNVGFLMIKSPLVTILETCAWARGQIHWKVSWLPKPIAASKRKSHIDIACFEGPVATTCAWDRQCSSLAGGTLYFTSSICGPRNGFRFMEETLSGQHGPHFINIHCQQVEEFYGYSIQAKFSSDFSVAGIGRTGFVALKDDLAGVKFKEQLDML
ncbi:polyprotein [peach leaf pitting-associated virus A]|uniref:RNA2 polyprotein n=1 Tax=peach leaf pitting-associated virus A TaxID=3118659 RepID=A0A290WNK5_9SECO|nr:polyprotein [Peach leaf pitting-associated virus]ATD53315.1 polyprotein [Peach leaf pitting-associated virus]